jgi:hypothetical protein
MPTAWFSTEPVFFSKLLALVFFVGSGMHRGYVGIWRKLLDWKYYQLSCYIHLWIHLLLKVNHKDNYVKGNLIKRGQTFTSRDALSRETGIHRSSVDRILKTLEIEHQIEQQKTNKYRIITIIKHGDYLISEPHFEQQVSNKRATAEQQLSTNNNDKNYKKEKKELFCRKSPPSDDAVLLINKLITLLVLNNPRIKHPRDLSRWNDVMDKIIRIDKRPIEEINKVIEWSQKDDFWKSNILSPQKLREKYDTLFLRMQQDKPKKETLRII